MKITKGAKLLVCSDRKGKYLAMANSDFDTDDEWFDVVLDQEYLEDLSNFWVRGEHVSARNGIDRLEIR